VQVVSNRHEQSDPSRLPRAIVLCPLQFEAHAVVSAGLPVRVEITGPGPAAMERAVRRLLDADDDREDVILFGLAGGLTESAGTAIVATAVRDVDGQSFIPPIAPTSGGGTVLGVATIVTTPGEKRALATATGANAVDTEAHVFASLMCSSGRRWGVIRGISDGPDDALPPSVADWVRPDGSTHAGRVLRDLMARPYLIWTVFRMARQSRRALRSALAELARLVKDEAR
jgi:hypothetical protein